MGSRKLRRQKFFLENPLCCFCGGSRKATEEDHFPSRTIFDNRDWPEGYNFPACEPCNRFTRADEQIISFLSRVYTDSDATDDQISEMRGTIDALRNNHPALLRSMRPSANEVRNFLKNHNLKRPNGAFLTDLPLIKLGSDELRSAVKRFGTKLFCALHYKHAGEILPPTAQISIKFLTNVQIQNGAVPEELLRLVPNEPTLVRCGNDLHDQFSYMYTVGDEKDLSVFVCGFRKAFALLGYVSHAPFPEAFYEDLESGHFLSMPIMHR